MDGIVSLLDPEHERLVRDVWADLEAEFGLHGVYKGRLPHFSYHIADAYDLAALEPDLAALARTWAPFNVHATGLAVFTGPQPVVHIPIVRTAALSGRHATVWPLACKTAQGVAPLYEADLWMPHITLAHGDVTPQMLPEVVRFLCDRNYVWDIRIDNIVVFAHLGTAEERMIRFNLTGEE